MNSRRPNNRFCKFCGIIAQAMFRLRFSLLASLLSLGCALRTAAPKSWDDALAEAEITLAKECGSECVAVLHSIVNVSSAEDGGKAELVMNAMSDKGLEQVERAHGLIQAVSVGTKAATRPDVSRLLSKGTACGTPAECELRELALNKCTYGRAALQNTYNSLNVVAHVLGSLVSSLCGCVHVGHVSHCILQNVPPMCTFPYTVYSKVFAGSVQVWEAVKASTKSCMMHRGPAIQE